MKVLHDINPLNNAEFLRHLWMEFSLLRLIIIPLLIIVVTITFGNLAQATISFYTVSLVAALASHMVFANMAAAGAMRDESTDNSWDFQRMSSLTGGELSMGKLYGATSLYSYCTALALIINIASVQFMHDLPHNLWLFMTFIGPLGLILCGFLGQSFSFLLSLNSFPGKRKYATGGHSFCGTLAGVVLLYYFTAITIGGVAPEFLGKIAANPYLYWHGIRLETTWFMIFSLAFFLFWTHIGLYRLMRTEMQYQNRPWVWIGFLITMLLYLTGLPEAFASANPDATSNPLSVPQKLLLAAFILLPVSYIGGYAWAGNISSYTRFFLAVQRRDWQAVSTSTPPWFINIGFCLFLLMLVALAAMTGMGTPENFALTLGLFLLVLRDIAVFHTIFMPGTTKHTGFLVLLYFVCLYVLGPKITESDHIAFFLPKGDWGDLAPLAAEVVIVGFLLYFIQNKARQGATA